MHYGTSLLVITGSIMDSAIKTPEECYIIEHKIELKLFIIYRVSYAVSAGVGPCDLMSYLLQ